MIRFLVVMVTMAIALRGYSERYLIADDFLANYCIGDANNVPCVDLVYQCGYINGVSAIEIFQIISDDEALVKINSRVYGGRSRNLLHVRMDTSGYVNGASLNGYFKYIGKFKYMTVQNARNDIYSFRKVSTTEENEIKVQLIAAAIEKAEREEKLRQERERQRREEAEKAAEQRRLELQRNRDEAAKIEAERRAAEQKERMERGKRIASAKADIAYLKEGLESICLSGTSKLPAKVRILIAQMKSEVISSLYAKYFGDEAAEVLKRFGKDYKEAKTEREKDIVYEKYKAYYLKDLQAAIKAVSEGDELPARSGYGSENGARAEVKKCARCHGLRRVKEEFACQHCGGSGKVYSPPKKMINGWSSGRQSRCDACRGTGKNASYRPCPACAK